MADTKAVLSQLDLSKTKSKLLAIVANLRGAEEAATFESINYLGYPFSISETFQHRNTNASIEKSFEQLTDMVALCTKHNKSLVVYISMGFGNPYGDEYNEDIVFHWANKIAHLGVNIISLADTVGLASPAQIKNITGNLIQSLPDTEIGVHLHSAPNNWKLKLEAAIEAGCVRFDGALKGFGGCPMAGDDLVGNMDTERLIRYFEATTALKNINEEALTNALAMASTIFS
jgi:hydroxymethylglutaryl-CoA lyase